MSGEREEKAVGGCVACLFCGKLASFGDKFCNSCGNYLLAPPVPGRAGAAPCREFRGIPPAFFPAGRPPVVGYPLPQVPAAAYPPGDTPRVARPVPPPPLAAPVAGGPQPPPAVTGAARSGWGRPAPPPSGTPAYRPPGRESKKAQDLATASVFCGIAGLTLLPVIAAAAAVVTGIMALSRLGSSQQPVEGEGLAAVGIILGAAGLAAAAILLVLLLAP